MQIIQPHYHAIARTAQDYERMAMTGVVAVCEPAFWAGFDRRYPETFIDYFAQISEFEPNKSILVFNSDINMFHIFTPHSESNTWFCTNTFNGVNLTRA